MKNASSRQTSVIARFAWTQRRGHLRTVGSAVLAVFLIAVALEAWRGTLADSLVTWNFWEPTLQFSILAIACLVWWGEVAQDWENSLSRRLTVWFLYPRPSTDTGDSARPVAPAGALGQVALLCKEAYLADEGDIRAWGQSIGGQMAKTPFLAFEPKITQTPRQIVWPKDDAPFLHYHVLFRLTDLPAGKDSPPDERFAARQLRLWERGRSKPEWETGGWLVEAPNGWELCRRPTPSRAEATGETADARIGILTRDSTVPTRC